MVLYPSLCFSLAPQNDICIFFVLGMHTCILVFTSSLPLSLSWTNFVLLPPLQSLFVARLPLSLSLKLPLSLLLLIVLNLYVALHLPRSSSFSHAAWFFHLVAFIFLPIYFSQCFSPVSLFLFFSPSSSAPYWCSLWQQQCLELLDISSVSLVAWCLVSSLIYWTH